MIEGADDDPQDAITDLEAEIDALAVRAAQCGRIAILAKGLALAGAAALVLLVVGALGEAPLALIGGLSALLGGLALLGTNSGTRAEIADALATCEARRDDLIALRDPRLVSPPPSPRELGGRRDMTLGGAAGEA